MTCPFIVIDYWKEDMSFDAMLINNADSARMATEYLIANGHKEIGYLRGDFRIKPFPVSFCRISDSAAKGGTSPNKDYIFTMATTIDGAYENMKRYLSEKVKLPLQHSSQTTI